MSVSEKFQVSFKRGIEGVSRWFSGAYKGTSEGFHGMLEEVQEVSWSFWKASGELQGRFRRIQGFQEFQRVSDGSKRLQEASIRVSEGFKKD